MRVAPDTIDEETTEDVIDIVMRALFYRQDKSAVAITWEELDRVAGIQCEIESTQDGVIVRRIS